MSTPRLSPRLSGVALQALSRVAVACVAVAALWMIWPREIGPMPAQGQALQSASVLNTVSGAMNETMSNLSKAVAQDTSQINDVGAPQRVAPAASSAAKAIIPAAAQPVIERAVASVAPLDRSPAFDYERGGSSSQAQIPESMTALSTPTFTPTPEATPTPTLSLAQMEAFNTEKFYVSPTPTPTDMPILRPTIEPVSVPAVKGRIWPDFVPAPAEAVDHYWVGNPFAPGVGTYWASPLYPYGSTAGGRYLLHHGVDMGGTFGTPLVAAASGEIVHAGSDAENILGPYGNFYGNSVVIRLDQRLATPDGERDVFVLYGHMSEVSVAVGQRVETGALVGYLGMTGIALGPHLHFEVRVGNNDYLSTVNPWLWMKPYRYMGTLAMRVLAADGSTWQGAKLSLIYLGRDGNKWVRTLITYLDAENIGPDPTWGENGVMGDLSIGTYLVVGKINDEKVEAQFTISEGQTTFVELRTEQ